MKQPDLPGTMCCSACHDVVDGRTETAYHHSHLERYLLDGIIRTQQELLKMGLDEVIAKWRE